MEISWLFLFLLGAVLALILCAALIVGLIFLIRYLTRDKKDNDKEIKKMKIEDL